MAQNEWQTLKATKLRERLVEIRDLLRQAAAVGLAQDLSRLEKAVEQHKELKEEQRAGRSRRRYR